MKGDEIGAADVEAIVRRLCLSCGLCCNGVLFSEGRLQPGDCQERLLALGLALERGADGLRFPQPCSCLEGTACRIYLDRPKCCRSFECGLLGKLRAGRLAAGVALRRILRARAQADRVRALVSRLGYTDERSSLRQQSVLAMSSNDDADGDLEVVHMRDEVEVEVNRLGRLLHEWFRR